MEKTRRLQTLLLISVAHNAGGVYTVLAQKHLVEACHRLRFVRVRVSRNGRHERGVEGWVARGLKKLQESREELMRSL